MKYVSPQANDTFLPSNLRVRNYFLVILKKMNIFCFSWPVVDNVYEMCFVLFDFFDIQWLYTRWEQINTGRSGINDGEGKIRSRSSS